MHLTEDMFTVDTRHPAARGREFTLDQAVRIACTLRLDPRRVRPVKRENGTEASGNGAPSAN